MEIKGDTVRDLVAARIAEYSNVAIYKEKARQDYPSPCFFVWQDSLSITGRVDNGILLDHKIVVQYKPAITGAEINENLDIGVLLVAILTKVPNNIEGQEQYPIFGLDMVSKITQERLVFNATFNLECKLDIEDFEKMKDLESTTKIKNGG